MHLQRVQINKQAGCFQTRHLAPAQRRVALRVFLCLEHGVEGEKKKESLRSPSNSCIVATRNSSRLSGYCTVRALLKMMSRSVSFYSSKHMEWLQLCAEMTQSYYLLKQPTPNCPKTKIFGNLSYFSHLFTLKLSIVKPQGTTTFKMILPLIKSPLRKIKISDFISKWSKPQMASNVQ